MRQVVISRGQDGSWVAECPSLPGCISQGQTREEALRNIKEAITFLMLPNTGSTVCLRKAYQARPARVCNRCCMRATDAVGNGNGGGSLKRACQDR